MNNRKYLKLLGNLTSTARKVFDAVPKQDIWNSQQVFAELKREGVRLDYAMVEGCLNSLVRDGLVRESRRGEFQAIHEPPVTTMASAFEDVAATLDVIAQEPATMITAAGTKTVNQATPDLLSKLASVAGTLRACADQIDEIALQAVAEVETARANNVQLEQLKATLRSVLA